MKPQRQTWNTSELRHVEHHALWATLGALTFIVAVSIVLMVLA
jgi:hypothetical protein